MALLIPTGRNADYYASGRLQARYKGQRPVTPDPPAGTPAYWLNEGVKDVWQGIPPRTGQESTLNDANGNPLPLYNGGGGGNVSPDYNTWADDYWLGYLFTLQNPPAGRARQAQGNVWSANYQKGIADALTQAVPRDPAGLVPTPQQLQATGLFPNGLPNLGGGGNGGGGGGNGGIVIRTPPPAPPRKNPADGVFVPPPGPVLATFEVYGVANGRVAPLDSVLLISGRGYRARPNTQIRIARTSNEGFGLAGMPGAWPRYYSDVSPANYGLDGRYGVMKWDDHARRGFAMVGSQLAEIFGPGWQATVYGQ